MQYNIPPVTAEQIAVFLEVSQDVLCRLCACKKVQDDTAVLFTELASRMGNDEETERRLQETMIPDVMQQDIKIREILASAAGQYMLTYLPLRYCRIDTISWLRRRCKKYEFRCMETALRASDRSIFLFFRRLCRSARERREHQWLQDVLDIWLEDHTLPQDRP